MNDYLVYKFVSCVEKSHLLSILTLSKVVIAQAIVIIQLIICTDLYDFFFSILRIFKKISRNPEAIFLALGI